MSIDLLSQWLGWTALINYGVLLFWFAAFTLARDLQRRIYSRWFLLSDPVFDGIQYGLMGLYKLMIFIFLLGPWVALQIVR